MSFYDEMRSARNDALRAKSVQASEDAAASKKIIDSHIGHDVEQQILRRLRETAKNLYVQDGEICRFDFGHSWKISRDITSCDTSIVVEFLSRGLERAFTLFLQEVAGKSRPVHVRCISNSMKYDSFFWAACDGRYYPDGNDDLGDPYIFSVNVHVGFDPPIT